jgi:DNA (cytosine-5)-methyltransferase 1
VKKLKFASFFAGIGGFDLGFERAGFKPVMQCEIDPYCQAVLRRHWPKVQLHDDIQTLNASTIPEADIWTAGWPCQDLSNANTNRQGLKGKRSGLFFDFSELAGTCRPTWLVLENVAGLLSAEQGTALETVADELEEIGYLGGWFSFNTLDAGLPQNRERVFIVASYQSDRAYQFFTHGGSVFGDTEKRRESRKSSRSTFSKSFIGDTPLLVQRRGGFGYTMAKGISPTLRAQTGKHQGGHTDRPVLCGQKLDVERVRESDGVPRGLDGRRGRFIGNSVSPVIAEWIALRIAAVEREISIKQTRNAKTSIKTTQADYAEI